MSVPRRSALALATVAVVGVGLLGADVLRGGDRDTSPDVSRQTVPRSSTPEVRRAAVGEGGVGSRSGGDPYFPLDGNGGYDVAHYSVKNTYVPADDRLTGRTRIRAVASHDLSGFHLDLALTPDAVLVDGRAARFGKPNRHELRVTPRSPLARGETFTVVVRYHGRPGDTRAAGLEPFFAGRGEAMAIGEPQIGPWWFACNETPTDKATYDISLRVPRGQQAISNGELVGKRSRGDWTTWRWEMTDPMTTYLAFFAAGRFELERDTVDGRPVVYAVSRLLGDTARERSFQLLRGTPAIVAWLEEQFGAYPYRSIGGVVTGLPVGFALENQSRPTYPYVGGPEAGTVALVVHEQAHQWFGNDVTLRRWKDTWVHEGFATYAEWLYAEEHGGDTVGETLASEYEAYPSGFWEVQVSDPGPDDMWDQAVYKRGGMMLAALRNLIGEDAHAELLRAWVVRHHDGNATGTAFRTLAEEVSGEQLDAFFAEWLDDTDRPERSTANGLPPA